MSIIDKIIPNSEDQGKKAKKAKKEENVLDLVKEEKAEAKQPAKLKEDTGVAHRVLRQYHLSEKTNALSTSGRYVFKIARNANKIEVKKAVEKVYDVHVTNVNIVNTKGKSRRYGRKTGYTSDWKKAIVTLKTGEKISGLTEGV